MNITEAHCYGGSAEEEPSESESGGEDDEDAEDNECFLRHWCVQFILWFTWVGKLFSGKSLEVNHLAREVPVLPEGHDVDLVAEPEFVIVDIEIITDALAVPGSMSVLTGATFVATLILVSVAIVGAGGTLAVAVFGIIVAVLTSSVLYRAFKV